MHFYDWIIKGIVFVISTNHKDVKCRYVYIYMKNQKKYVLLCSHLFGQERSGVCQGKNEGTGGT